MTDTQRFVPIFVYEDIEAAQRFLVRAFGFEPGMLNRTDDGVVHGEVSMGGQDIWLHRVSTEFGLASPKSVPVTTSGLVVFVDDVDAHHRHAVEEGATVDYPPTDMPYGQREYGTRDSEGGLWCFATRLGD